MKKIIGVRFKKLGKTYHFECLDGYIYKVGQNVIVETSRGGEYATVVLEEKNIDPKKIVSPLKPVLRLANDEDKQRHDKNMLEAQNAFLVCKSKIIEHNLDMNLIDNEYTFDRTKLIFYFTAEGRIDFRFLVKDLASIFKTRIELRQIGVRDEAKKIGGYGSCGREYCCKKWLGDFQTVTIKMAKDQELSLNPTKISGSCGRLFCCLKFENDTYESIIKTMPSEGSLVKTPYGVGKVIQKMTILEKVKVLIEIDEETQIQELSIKEMEVLKKQ